MTFLLRASLVLAASLLLARWLPTPSRRRDLLTAGAVATLALPLLALLPGIPVPTGSSIASLPSAPMVAVAATTLQEPASAASTGAGLWGALWLLGTGLLTLRTCIGMARIARIPWRAPDSAWEEAAHIAGVPVQGHPSLGPLVAGWVRPAVVVPHGVDWPLARRVRALRHERAHLRSRDTLRILLLRALTAVCWMHPLAWWLARELRVAMEQAADAAVVHAGTPAEDVAADLVDFARGLPMAAGWASRPLERRVHALLGSRPPLPKAAAAGVAAALASVVLLAGARGEAVAGDVDVQRRVDAEVARLVERWHPEAVAITAIDLRTDAVVEGRYGRARGWTPGSVGKPFVALAAQRSGHPIDDVELARLLEVSDNEGFVELATDVGSGPVAKVLQVHGLHASPDLSPTDLALGQFPATTSELASAYAQLALTPEGRRVVSLLESVVHGAQGTGRQAAVQGTTVAGKTGTARLDDGNVLASFVGLVPADAPRWAIAVQVAAPEGGGWGGKVAAPGFARLAQQLP